MKWSILIIVVVCSCMVLAEDLNNNTAKDNGKSEDSSAVEGRRRHGFGRFPFHHAALWFTGFPLALLIAFKFKLLIISFVVGAAVLFGSKYFIGKGITHCPEIIRESPPPSVFTSFDHGHFSKRSYSSHGPPPSSGWSSSSYPAIEPYHSYSSDNYAEVNPELSAGPEIIHDEHSLSGGGEVSFDPSVHSEDRISKPYRRVTRQKRDILTEDKDINWGEFLFSFLGVKTMACKQRFICEMGFRARSNPITKMAYSFMNLNFFGQYRSYADARQVTKFTDCGVYYPQCKAPGETDDNEPNQLEEEEETDESINDVTSEKVKQISEPIKRAIFNRSKNRLRK